MGKRGRKRLADITLSCGWCKKDFIIRPSEYNRQVKKGRLLFFCSLNCGGFYSNSTRPGRVVVIEKICLYCNKKFTSSTSKRSASFCSRSCASIGSVHTWSDEARKRQVDAGKKHVTNLMAPADSLRKREWWKYTVMNEFLNTLCEPHRFEFVLGKHIFDLALIKRRLLIEFDSDYHDTEKQLILDKEKDLFANSLDWQVIRIKVQSNTAMNPLLLKDTLMGLK